MSKTILITGSTDGIGLATAGRVETYIADLSRWDEVAAMATAVASAHDKLDVLINNAGVFRTPNPITPEGLDVRFAVNAIAPYLLTQRLLPMLGIAGRVINLSSAAQSPVNLDALAGRARINDMNAYSQSKLALTTWSRQLARTLSGKGPIIVAVNPGSLLGSKMVKEGFGVDGADINIGADILVHAALSDDFSQASGKYFDNDTDEFAAPHPDVLDPDKAAALMLEIEAQLADS